MALGLDGVLDADSVPTLREAVADRPAAAALVIDLQGLDFIDSTGIELLVQIQAASAGPPPWAFALVLGGPWVHRVFEILGLVSQLRWVDEPEDLLRAP